MRDRRERRGERMTPDLSFLIGVACGVLLSLQGTCHVSASGSWILSGWLGSVLQEV